MGITGPSLAKILYRHSRKRPSGINGRRYKKGYFIEVISDTIILPQNSGTWESSDPSVVSFYADGVIIGVRKKYSSIRHNVFLNIPSYNTKKD